MSNLPTTHNSGVVANDPAMPANTDQKTGTPKTIYDMPDLVMFVILDNIPLCQLFHANEVCKWWHRLRDPALLRRRTVILVPSEDHLETLQNEKQNFEMLNLVVDEEGNPTRPNDYDLKKDTLLMPDFALETVDRVMEHIPNLTTLRIIHNVAPLEDALKIKMLLINYRDTLVDLTLWFWADNDEIMDFEDPGVSMSIGNRFLSLIRSLNALSNLKYLSLNLQTPYEFEGYIPFNLSVISQLKELNLRTWGFSGAARTDVYTPYYSLKTYAEPNTEISEVLLHNFVDLSQVLSYSPDFSKAFTEVHIEDDIKSSNFEHFQLFCSRFTNLRDFTFRMLDISMETVSLLLCNMKSLVHIAMTINMDPTTNEQVAISPDDPERLAVCPSVTALSLFIYTSSHNDIANLQLHRIFPNVQVILLRRFSKSCHECGYNLNDPELEDGAAALLRVPVKQCTIMARKAFKAFTKLQKLCTNMGPSPIEGPVHDGEFDWASL